MTTLSIPSSWRTTASRYRLAGSKCSKDKLVFFPPRAICTKCSTPTEEGLPMTGKGDLVDFTVIHVPPVHHQLQTPYIIGLVKLEEGPVITTQIVGVGIETIGDLKIGLPMQATFRKYGSEAADAVIVYGYKFTPANLFGK